MADVLTISGKALKGGTCICLARVVNRYGAPVKQADINSIAYTIWLIDTAENDTQSPVSGHENIAVTAANVLYDTLPTDAIWTEDPDGYNFMHEVVVAGNPAFAAKGQYWVQYTLVPDAGQVILLRFIVTII